MTCKNILKKNPSVPFLCLKNDVFLCLVKWYRQFPHFLTFYGEMFYLYKLYSHYTVNIHLYCLFIYNIGLYIHAYI